MPNAFPKEIRVAFDETLEAYQDALVLSRHVNVRQTNPMEMERSSDVKWFPMNYITQSFAGQDQSANFVAVTQLSIPEQIDQWRSVPFTLSATELRDLQQSNLLKKAASNKLASDINVA